MNLQRAQLGQHIARLLDEETRLLAELEELLLAENTVLRDADTDAIEGVSARRQQCVSALTRIDVERQDCCRLFSFGNDRLAFERLLQSLAEGPSLRRHWQRNLASARRCKEHNDRNGAIVNVRLNAVRQRLAVLRGASRPPVYGRRTERSAELGSRNLGTA